MLERVLRFIEAQVTAGEVRVGTLARLAPLSLFHFIRSFKDSTGVSPHQFVLQRRIEHAKALLAEGRHSSEVALDVGFASPSSFAAAFRRVTRTTPSAFRLAPAPSMPARPRVGTRALVERHPECAAGPATSSGSPG